MSQNRSLVFLVSTLAFFEPFPTYAIQSMGDHVSLEYWRAVGGGNNLGEKHTNDSKSADSIMEIRENLIRIRRGLVQDKADAELIRGLDKQLKALENVARSLKGK
jgi:hypothetical protein